MPITKITFKSEGFRTLNTSAEAQAAVMAVAEAIAARAGDGFEARQGTTKNRARASVFAATREAQKAEADDKALTTALGGV